MDKILVTGALGQLGLELVKALQDRYGQEHVIATDIREPEANISVLFEILNVMDANAMESIIQKHQITQIYHLAALLSAKGEGNPKLAWALNMQSLLFVLDLSVKHKIQKVFFPSSIGVFGPTTPMDNTPQHCSMEPTSVYGISKLAGEGWCQYYHDKYNLDVRSVRFPGLIGYKSLPGGGTTDYAVDIYIQALKDKSYQCFLSEGTYLPMMYMDDAIRAILELMDAPAQNIKVRTSYNLSAMSFSPKEIAQSIQKNIPTFEITYAPDYRQAIADSWPNSIDDTSAQNDWGWKPQFDLDKMTEIMLKHLA